MEKQLPWGKMYLQNGVFICDITKGAHIDVAEMDIWADTAAEFSAGQPFTFVVNLSDMKSVSKEARRLKVYDDERLHIIAGAIQIKSVLSKMLANFFLQMNKIPSPIKIFNEREKALAWLANLEKDYKN